jgi:predicted TIM-barrel fold metal-dependent hydrolase
VTPLLVDTHVHVVSPDEDRYPLQPSTLTGPWYRDEPCSVERLLDLMGEARVDRAVLVQAWSAYAFDNRYTADSARRHADCCTSVPCIDVTAPDAVECLRAAVERDAMRGLRWFSVAGDLPLRTPVEVWRAARSLGVPVVVTAFAHRLGELADVATAFPDVAIALDHCGFVDFSRGVPDELAALAGAANVHLKVSTHVLDDAGGHGDVRELVCDVVSRFGAHRVMWGSDWSQTHHHPYPELVEQGRRAASALRDDDRAAFLGGTALSMWPELA